MRITIVSNLLAVVVSFGLAIWYTVRYEYSLVFSFFMTFFWGIQDAGLNCLINCVLGFQFDSKITPFSVYYFA